MKLERNIGSFEVAARVVVGCGLLIVANHGHSIAGVAAAVVLACAVLRFCPLWWMLRINSAVREKTYGGSRWPDDEN